MLLLAELDFQTVAYFVVGLSLVIWGADIFVSGASRLAVLLNISPMLVAVTVVAFASSAPELFVSFELSQKGNSAGALSNIIGSNICNIALVIGLCAIIYPFKMEKKFFTKEFIFFMLSAVMFMIFLSNDNGISRMEGLVLFATLMLFFVFCIMDVKKQAKTLKFVEEDIVPGLEDAPKEGVQKWARSILALVGGLVALVYGSTLVVKHGQVLGEWMNLGKDLIGLFVFALGTSLPELAISVTAALKKEEDIAIGNIIGSNIFNILCVGGLVSSINPLVLKDASLTALIVNIHLPVMLIFSFAFLAFLRVGRSLNRLEGVVLLTGYGFYVYAALYVWK